MKRTSNLEVRFLNAKNRVLINPLKAPSNVQ